MKRSQSIKSIKSVKSKSGFKSRADMLSAKFGADASKEETAIPNYGLKVDLDHVYPENRSQSYTPSFKQLWVLLPLIFRYVWYYIKCKTFGRPIVMDYLKTVRSKRIYGVPMGGIGSGTIGRGYRGEFCRFQLRPGLYDYNVVDANQFIVTIKDKTQTTIFQSLLSTYKQTSLKSWKSCIKSSNCSYTGLYPRAWTEYNLSEYGVKLICRQISPIIPNNYKDTSLPATVFVWTVINTSNEARTVTIAFTFKNGTGNKSLDKKATCNSKAFTMDETEGVILYHTIDKQQCSYALSANSNPDITVTKCLHFDPNSNGSTPWNQLSENGCFNKCGENSEQIFGEMACGIAAQTIVESQQCIAIEMSLVWHMPVITFPERMKTYNRYYSTQFGSLITIVEYVFNNYRNWESAIYKWQAPVLLTQSYPDWYKGALFNETYYVSDGGSIWLALEEEEAEGLPANDPRIKYGRFALLEGQEYRMYNTYDVHFYASFAFVVNWPFLQHSLQYDMRDAIFTEIKTKVKMLYDGHVVERKKPDSVPHDIGDPGEEPFILLNSYPIHDVSLWRDLNTKFVLQVFRDAFINNTRDPDLIYLTDMYDACRKVMQKTNRFDYDNDGLIENSCQPDQTYDTWIMCGSSAYCGGLWLAALFAMSKIAHILGKQDDEENFQRLLDKGRVAFDRKLWNGAYYNFDCSRDEASSIMADQLCGHWYLRCTGFEYEVFKEERVQSVLQTIYHNNVRSFCRGKMGAVNGFINGEVDKFTVQSMEVWTGVTYALASNMIHEHMIEEGFKTAGGMYESMTKKFGLAFDTPEALYETKYYRAVAYMRPLSIWSMHIALKKNIRKTVTSLFSLK